MDDSLFFVVFILLVASIKVQGLQWYTLYNKEELFPSVQPKSSIQYIRDEKSFLRARNVCDVGGQTTVPKVRLTVNNAKPGNDIIAESGTYECLAINGYGQTVLSLPFEVKKLDVKSDTFIDQKTFTHFLIDCGIQAEVNRSDFRWSFTCTDRDIRDQLYKDANGSLHFYFVNEIKTNLTCTFNGSSHKTILSVVHKTTKFRKNLNCSKFHQRFDRSAWTTEPKTMLTQINLNEEGPFSVNTTVTQIPYPTTSETLASEDPCSNNQCQERSSCIRNGTKYKCNCLNGFSGDYCEIDNRICQCSDNGSCPTIREVNICQCPDGVEDKKCIEGIPKFVFAINNTVTVEVGEHAVLECFVSSDCAVEWLLTGGNMTAIRNRNISGPNQNRLTIYNVSMSYTGTYRCDCSNNSFVNITLHVTEPVVLNAIIMPKDGVYFEDTESRYQCSFDEEGYNVSYYVNGKLHHLSDMGIDNLNTIQDKYLLINHDSHDRGSCVQCLVEYKNKKKLLQSCSLTITRIDIDEPPKKTIPIYLGSDLNVTFQATTKPQTNISYTMFQNDIFKLAIVNQNIFRFLVQNLSRDNINDYPGQYTINVYNGYENKTVRFSVVLKGNEVDAPYYFASIVPLVILIVVLICFIRKYKWIKKKFRDRKVKRTVSKEFFNMSAVDRYSKMPCQQEGFPRQRLRIQETLGEGNFGKVVKAEALDISGNGTWETVAVKMCKETATDLQKEDFSHELSLIKRIPKHPNVVSYLGYCKSLDQPTFIILEYISGGNLLQFLRDRRPGSGSKSNKQDLDSSELSSFAHQIAKGLAHLSHHNIIHRDIAARNILISESHACKVADLGLARDLYESDVYEIASKGGLPIRWMAPESLTDGLYTTQSDIWSYGVLLWEITTLGASPYPGLSARQVMSTVVGGNKLECPEFCSQNIKDMIMKCWEIDNDKRPTFDQICTSLEGLLEEQSDYLNLQNYEEGIYSVLYPTNYAEKL